MLTVTELDEKLTDVVNVAAKTPGPVSQASAQLRRKNHICK